MPGDSLRKIEKGAQLPADSIVMDLEDAVAPGNKALARRTTHDALRTLDFGRRERLVRVNAWPSGYFHDDVAETIAGRPDGYVIPKAEGRAILACTWTSTKFPHRAPEGYGLIRAFIGRAGADDVVARPDTDLLALAQAEVREVLGVTAAPTLSRVFRWPQAMPQYTLGHLDRVRTVERCLAGRPGLWVAGNAYSGIGLPDCIASGEKAAEAAGAYLRALAPAARPMPG